MVRGVATKAVRRAKNRVQIGKEMNLPQPERRLTPTGLLIEWRVTCREAIANLLTGESSLSVIQRIGLRCRYCSPNLVLYCQYTRESGRSEVRFGGPTRT